MLEVIKTWMFSTRWWNIPSCVSSNQSRYFKPWSFPNPNQVGFFCPKPNQVGKHCSRPLNTAGVHHSRKYVTGLLNRETQPFTFTGKLVFSPPNYFHVPLKVIVWYKGKKSFKRKHTKWLFISSPCPMSDLHNSIFHYHKISHSYKCNDYEKASAHHIIA